MSTEPMITTSNEITLITLQNCPSELTFTADVFQKISGFGVNVDMISLAPTHGAFTSISFTISDNDLDKILTFTSDLHDNSNIKTIVSSGNCKISVYDQGMKDTPGVAAKVFAAAAKSETDIRIITTSEVDISLLVTAADFDQTLNEIEKCLKK
ncbi:ACT domain-containing protein [Caproiciproducens sp. R2]|uniref:ACT domain-containing protein n=1 Tax=Caproiciproducens sp. R2 TaxID=3435187 RepID=UPI004034DE62